MTGAGPDVARGGGRSELLARLRERILGFAASRCGRDIAEDLAQEVLLVLEQKYGHVGTLEELVPLSFEILRFKMTAWRRKTIRRGEHTAAPVDEVPIASSGPDPEEAAAREENLARLSEAVARLGERCRELLRLKLEGLSFEEIRQAMGASAINTVYTWDHRCRKELLERLGGRWVR
ncbi:MAG TPA: sigma-70 family RNA polymerase sigma factor [Solibacterales bacterium]|nr:sigma-70 family RNA polymerase sigma factor [Bryobacterales bacterium]